MIMHSISILILLPVLSFVLSFAIRARHHLFHRQTNSTLPFILRAFQPGSPVHLFSLNANDGHFWLGKTTSSSCPAALEPHCPKGTDTALVVLSDESASLDADVPAGQDIYVAKDGALSFTEAYEEDVASLAYPSGFSYGGSTDASAPGYFTFSGTPSKGWLACPMANMNGPWQVYADIRRANVTGCLKFEARGETYEGDRVWQYD